MKTLVVLPAFNEATTITEVIASLPPEFDRVVIDDGSTDKTGDIARDAGVRVVTHRVNRGLGAALRTGFAFAVRGGYDAVVTLDADGQHDPAEIGQLLVALEGGADIVIGRRIQSHMPRIRQYYNAIGGIITSGLFGTPMVDAQSGFRALRTEALQRMELRTSRMEISSEVIAEAHRIHLRISEVPISVRYTEYSLSKGQSLGEGARTAWRLFMRSVS